MSDSQTPDISQLKTQAQAAMDAAEAAMRAKDGLRLLTALQGCDQALKALPEETVVAETGAPDPANALARERALLWLWRGRLLVMADKIEVVIEGLHSLDQAIARLQAAGARKGAEEALAIAWMNRGGGLFRIGNRDALTDAVRSYDRAIELLERAPEGGRNALGAALMNRGVGLLRLNDANDSKESVAIRLSEAQLALERAVAVLEPLPAPQTASRHNLASAWANLGMVRAMREDSAGALAAHRTAVEVFRPLAAEGAESGSFELAARLFNLGQAAGVAGETETALAAGREALGLVEALPVKDPQVIELALRTRHALCVILGGLLAAGRAKTEDPARSARLEEAGDLVEDGLARLREHGPAVAAVAAAGTRLYEFGAWLYRTQQPQFLGEFLLEHLGEDPVRAQAAAAAVRIARQDFVQRSFADTTHGGMERVLEALQDLGAVEARVKAILPVS